MAKGIIGKKLGMTNVFADDGRLIPVTVVEAGPCRVVQIKSVARDGYDAVQLGFIDRKASRVNKPLRGHFKKGGVEPSMYLREIRDFGGDMKTGDLVSSSVFEKGEKIEAIGTSKGKGFAGVMKRHGFSGGAESHGSMFNRAPGSIGSSAYPSRVWAGKKLPGHMGDARVTVKGLEVVAVEPEKNLILIKGAVPGAIGSLVVLQSRV